jgi:glucose-1-phosphate adenylyltransferase
MDYSKMLEDHKKNGADATLSVFEVPLDEASRFGLVIQDENKKIVGFEEKPKNPQSTLASMGVYIFTWEILREYLIRDDADSSSSKDFGKNIIPNMLEDGLALYAYAFQGYWKDVGTIQSYWESNMDLIERVPDFNLFDHNWKIYTTNPIMPAHYIGMTGVVKKSIIAEGCKIHGTVRNSIIFPGVTVEEGALIEDSIVMSNSVIGRNATITKAILAEKVMVGENVQVGIGESVVNMVQPDIYNTDITVVAEGAVIPNNAKLGKNVVIHKKVNESDYISLEINSGETVFKGGAAHE